MAAAPIPARFIITDQQSWETAWENGITSWDRREIQPSLREAIEYCKSDLHLPSTGRAFVPGCGGGYDAVYIGSATGYDTLGLDVSKTAIARANEYLASQHESPAVRFTAQDFFSFEVPDEAHTFDLVYDHTFFVAIPPAQRPAWAERMAALVKPNGYLITLVYPLDERVETGPPFYVRPEHYSALLSDSHTEEDGSVRPGTFTKLLEKIPKESSESHKNREKIMVWKRNSV